ncbi:endonuclease-reverse transcriptase [Elysia marginata]|uniref:Endonuclease-reverse transcriptase n=1 Tax=Elysia marginata TaxID=1093978 RepID=A0AAV4HCX7_9GAST|nr:endonuclease-reverse transcriptase [Elysia marginata]
MVMGDLNSEVGNDDNGFERNMRKHGLGLRNDDGQRFLNLCVENDLIIGGTFFKHKKNHKETWKSSDGVTRNEIAHMAINRRWRSSLQNTCESYPRSPGFGKTSVVMDKKNRKVITIEEDQCTSWEEHFKEILNRPDPEQSLDVGRNARELELKRRPITCKEIEKAVEDSKSNRAPGEDSIKKQIC